MSGWIWDDANHDGVQNNGEMGFGSPIQILLLDANGNTVATTYSVGGLYSFINVPNGTYRIKVVLPTGFAFAPPNQGDDNFDSDVDATGHSGLFVIDGWTLFDLDAGAYAI